MGKIVQIVMIELLIHLHHDFSKILGNTIFLLFSIKISIVPVNIYIYILNDRIYESNILKRFYCCLNFLTC